MRNTPLKAFAGEDGKLKDLRGKKDRGQTNMPVKKSGFGPRTSFGGSKNPELQPDRKAPQRKVMKDGPKNSVHGIDLGKDPHWRPHQFRK